MFRRTIRFVAKTVAVVTVASGAGVLLAKYVMDSMHHSVGIEKPTKKQLEEENQDNHALFRYLPELKRKIAWRQLGNYPTPIHRGTYNYISKDHGTARFYVKREDLSSPYYGGNKVRTLQHQLAVCEAKDATKKIYVTGTGGSNQIIATIVHGYHRLKLNVCPIWMQKDVPDLDNTLNMLSTLSFHSSEITSWADGFAMFQTMLSGILGSSSFFLPPGGNNPAGVLGQVGGLLELAEQIQNKEVPDPDGIFVAMGSSCTVSGLIIGVALCEHLNLNVFQSNSFKVHGVPIHDGIAGANRSMNFFKASWSQYIPLSIRHTIQSTCNELKKAGGPDLTEMALHVFETQVVIHDDEDVVGIYGGHSTISKNVAVQYDSIDDSIKDINGKSQKPLWLCGHFTAKAFTHMIEELKKDQTKDFIFWQTKSALQPLGPEDEWSKLKNLPDEIKVWANEGKSESIRRPGHVDTKHGNSMDYRHLMTKVDDALSIDNNNTQGFAKTSSRM
jgi:hypothetical protein